MSIQNSHTIYTEGNTQPLLRTGYEYVMAARAGKLYCTIADEAGKVIRRTDKVIVVEYKSGKKVSVKLGTVYGRLEGGVYPHNLVSSFKTGDTVKPGDYIAYNTNFFEPDWLDPTKLIMKTAKTVTVALTCTKDVHDDSSAISRALSESFVTSTAYPRSFVLKFEESITNLLTVGTEVSPQDALFTLLDAYTDASNLTEANVEMLQNLANTSPKAKYRGVIDRYEMRYNGDVSDMSPSLRKIASMLDYDLQDETFGSELEIKSGRVTHEHRVQGKNLEPNTLEFIVYIRVQHKQQNGDKGSFANQMKSVVSEVYSHQITTESGVPVHAKFSYIGVINRVVSSPILIGLANRLLKFESKNVADIYFK